MGVCGGIGCCGFCSCACVCVSYCVVCLYVQLNALKLHQQQIQADQRDTARMHEECLQGPWGGWGWGGSNRCAVRTLCPQHTSHRCIILVRFTEINTPGRNRWCCCRFTRLGCCPPLALACGVASFDGGEDQPARDLRRAGEPTANPTYSRRYAEGEYAFLSSFVTWTIPVHSPRNTWLGRPCVAQRRRRGHRWTVCDLFPHISTLQIGSP